MTDPTDPHVPMASASSPDDDPTGVHALLSGLPEPDPMPDHLVERINASLAAAQAQRAASTSGASVTPLVRSTRRRPGRVLFVVAGAAAAVALVAVLGGNLFRTLAPAGSGSSDAAAIASSSREGGGAGMPATPLAATPDKAAVAGALPPPLIEIRQSETRYTRAEFATQARTLRSAAYGSSQAYGPNQPMAVETPGIGRIGTAVGLTDCLRAIGAGGAQMVRADLAFYEGVPAVIIVTTTDGIPTAYAMGRECSKADAAVLRSATPLP